MRGVGPVWGLLLVLQLLLKSQRREGPNCSCICDEERPPSRCPTEQLLLLIRGVQLGVLEMPLMGHLRLLELRYPLRLEQLRRLRLLL